MYITVHIIELIHKLQPSHIAFLKPERELGKILKFMSHGLLQDSFPTRAYITKQCKILSLSMPVATSKQENYLSK